MVVVRLRLCSGSGTFLACAKVWRHRASKSPRWLVGKSKPTRARAGGILASSGKSWGTAESFHVDRIRFASSRRAGDGFGFGTFVEFSLPGNK